MSWRWMGGTPSCNNNKKKSPPFNICPAEGCNWNGCVCWEWAGCQRVIEEALEASSTERCWSPFRQNYQATLWLCCCWDIAQGVYLLAEKHVYRKKKKWKKKQLCMQMKSCVIYNARSLTLNAHLEIEKSPDNTLPHVWKSSTGCQLQLRVNP